MQRCGARRRGGVCVEIRGRARRGALVRPLLKRRAMQTITVRIVSVLFLGLLAAGCSKGASAALSKYAGTDDGARQLITDLRTADDAAALTQALKPTSADYAALFDGDAAAKAEDGYAPLWADAKTVIGADPANTEVLIMKATTDDLKAWTPQANADFPGGYERAAKTFKSGLTVYRWKYVKPGATMGMAFDGLVFVNGHWAWFPKPWRALGA